MSHLYYCCVHGGKKNFDFHGWLSNVTIENLKNEGCVVQIQDYKYQ